MTKTIECQRRPRDALTRSEVEAIRKWISAGAPDFPDDVATPTEPDETSLANLVGMDYVLQQITEFVTATPREDRPYLRFFSSNHLLASGATAEELRLHHQALAKAINHLSMQPVIVRPEVIDEGVATVFAVDIRRLGWNQRPYRSTDGEVSNINLYDLVLLEYPYGVVYEDSEHFEQLWDSYLSQTGLVRPIPFVRIDWFVSVATQFPLYEDLLNLPHHLSDLEEQLGVDTESNMQSFVAQRAGVTVSGVSQNNRVVERHPARHGAYWKSYDFQTSKGRQNMFVDPIHFHYAGGEMIFNLPNGLQGYLITDAAGTRINAAPTDIVTDKFAADKVVRNGLACMRCHDKGMRRFADNIRPAVEALRSGSMANRKDVLRLYPNKQGMDSLLDIDERRFMAAMQEALGNPQEKEPLADVSREFLDNAISMDRAVGELGLHDGNSLAAVFSLPEFTRLGLASLTTGGVVRRDTWEDYFDRIVRQLGVGSPIPPLDGLIREDHLAEAISQRLFLRTNKRSNIFSPGETARITIENRTGIDLFIEIIGTSVHGKIVRITEGVVPLADGAQLNHPSDEGYIVQSQLGSERVTVFASPTRFRPGQLLTAKNSATHVADRFVHDWYRFNPTQSPPIRGGEGGVIKKTLEIQTR